MTTKGGASSGKGKKKADDLDTQMELVDNETFLKNLTSLFEGTKVKGTVWLTHKRYSYDPNEELKTQGSTDENEYKCLLRATDGTTKFETLILSADLAKFHLAYGTLLRTSTSSAVKKRDKKKEKKRAEEAALRKKRLEVDVVIEGPKRGNGRKKRVRKIKAAIRQEEARKAAAKREEARSKAEVKAEEMDLP